MEKSVKATTVTGFILFALAATFSIALLLVLGDFAGQNPATVTGLYRFGKMLTSVYGVCSVLIPLFLITAAIQCFTETWTAKRGVLLVGSVLPFFTLDAAEHVVRMMAANNEGIELSIKLIGVLLTSALILAAEYLLLSLLGDLISNAVMKREDGDDSSIDDDFVLDDVTDVVPPRAPIEEMPVAVTENPPTAAEAVPATDANTAVSTSPAHHDSAGNIALAPSVENDANDCADVTNAEHASTATVTEHTAPSAEDTIADDVPTDTEAFLASAATLDDGSENPFAHIFDSDHDETGSLTPESLAALENPVDDDSSAPADDTRMDSDSAAGTALDNSASAPDAGSSFVATLLAAQAASLVTVPIDEAHADVADDETPADSNAGSATTALHSDEQPVESLPDVSSRELRELGTFDPEKDSFDGYQPPVEEIDEAEALDDDIAAFEQQNADNFDDDFYDIDLNAEDDELAHALADYDDADDAALTDDFDEQLPESDEAEANDSAQAEAIAVEEQKSTNLNDIFAEMDDDAAREPVLHDEVYEEVPAVIASNTTPAVAVTDDAHLVADGTLTAADEALAAASGVANVFAASDDYAVATDTDFTIADDLESPVADATIAESDGFADDDRVTAVIDNDVLAEPDLSDIEITENEEPFFAEETAIDESELEETVSGEIGASGFTDISADEFDSDRDESPVVDPLEPPVVDSDGVPYDSAVPIDLDALNFDDSTPKSEAVPLAHDDTAPQLKAPRTQSATFTVTAAAPAPQDAPAHNDALVSEPARRKNYGVYSIPTEGILDTYANSDYQVIDDATRRAADELKATLGDFKIEAEVTGIRKGPVVTMFELLPAPGVKLSKIVALQDNIALRLAASSVRIVAPIPGKHAVGIEVPNKERAIVSFKEIIEQDLPQFKKMAIPVVLGKDISGEAQLLDLAKTPHLLIAGSTGAGKSVCVNTMILSILYKRSPQQVKLIMIDPKVVELKLYNDIPHLLTPVITEPKRAFQSLQYCLCEMERRYALLDGMGVRDIVSYNTRIVERHIATEKLPYIVVIIDEFADLMATTGKELETTLARLAAMSRAVGIHLVLATQRPSIDVITGLIKANIPSRIAFMVASKMDSRIIIDQVGAEKLLGKGDMLYASATDPFPVRIQGTLVNDNEVERVVTCVKEYGEPEYIDDEIFVDDDDDSAGGASLFNEGEDPLYDEALEIVLQAGKASASYIQRRLKIGYNRAARLVEEMEERGIVGPANGSKPREVIHMPS